MEQDEVVKKYLIPVDDFVAYMKSAGDNPVPDYDILARKSA